DHVIIGEPPAETAADARHMDGDLLFIDPQSLRHQSAPGSGILRRCPDLDIVALRMRRAVHRLKRGMSNKWIGISGLDRATDAAESGLDVAITAPALLWRRMREGCRLLRKTRAALLPRLPFVPDDLELLARLFGLPPARRNDRNPGK